MRKLTDLECEQIWENLGDKKLLLDAEGLQVMDWVRRKNDMKLAKNWDWKSGIN